MTRLERQALGFVCVRAAALARRRGQPDPLDGVERLDTNVLERLGIARAELDRQIVSDAVQWAATLMRVDRADESRALLDKAASIEGAPSRAVLARRAQRLLFERAARHGRAREAARRALAWARAEEP